MEGAARLSAHHKLMQISVCELQSRINSEERGLHVETFTLMKKDPAIRTGNNNLQTGRNNMEN